MNVQDLRYIVAVAETGHFGRAAQACYISQPTLSTQIKKLEDELGVRLFERTNKWVKLTPVGEAVVAQARVILEEVTKLRQLAQGGRDPLAGQWRLGVIPTLGPYLLPHLLPHIRNAFPQLQLYIREELTARLLEQLRRGTLDVVLLALPVDYQGLEVVELFEEPFVLALPAGHPLARKRRVREADLQGQRLLLLEDGHCLRDQALAVCGFRLATEAEDLRATSLETLRQMVAAGTGCTLLPALATQQRTLDQRLIVLRPFAPPAPGRRIGLLWRQTFPHREAALSLAQLVHQHLPPGVIPVAGTTLRGDV